MIRISGVNYLVEKEVSQKYGLSLQWFQRARYNHNGPTYHKLHGKFYYTEEEVEAWFKENMVSNG